MNPEKILFIDRDGTLIDEPPDGQVDAISKFYLLPGVIPALLKLKQAGFKLVMITNQDGLGTASFPQKDFEQMHRLLMSILSSQGIEFDDVLICPHFEEDRCECRKPRVGLVLNYLTAQRLDRLRSFVIGDRETDMALANKMGIMGIRFDPMNSRSWEMICHQILNASRKATFSRTTKETNIEVNINLDEVENVSIKTGLGFFDHLLEQLAKHGHMGLTISASGDLHIDEHHLIEDTAIALGAALKEALGDKMGIARYGFVLPMDEALSQVALDLSGRGYLVFKGEFKRESVGGFPTELVSHFFHSFAMSLGATLHINVEGENEHHKIESIFKAVGRALRQAAKRDGLEMPSTKGTCTK